MTTVDIKCGGYDREVLLLASTILKIWWKFESSVRNVLPETQGKVRNRNFFSRDIDCEFTFRR